MSANSRFAYRNPDAGRAQTHDAQMLERLIKARTLLNKKQKDEDKRSQTIRELLALENQPDQLKSPEIRQEFLKIMIELGSVEGVQKAIDKGADLNQFLPGSDLSALDFAVSQKQTGIVRHLLDLDTPSMKVTRQKGETLKDSNQTIHEAGTNKPEALLISMLKANDSEGIKLSLKRNPAFLAQKKLTLLEFAASVGAFECVAELVTQGEKVSKLAKDLALDYVKTHPEKFNENHSGYFLNKNSKDFDADKNMEGLKKLLSFQRNFKACHSSRGSLKKVTAILFANSAQSSNQSSNQFLNNSPTPK